MGVGQSVTKQTWLLNNVEIMGIVRVGGRADGEEVGIQDDFDVEPDPNYRHLIGSFPANNPLYWNPGFGCMHCETYPLPAEQVNRVEPWPLEMKPAETPFEAINPVTGVPEPLRVGAHVRLVGRWTIDHHPEQCVTRARGWLRVGCAHTELHPFRWDQVELVVAPQPGDVVAETLSLAAPLHEEVYLGGGKWLANEIAGVASKIFVADDASNYHNSLNASMHIPAPPLPSGFTAAAALISYREDVLRNGTSMSVSLVRSITVLDDGIRVDASVTAPGTVTVDAHKLGDVDDPARLRSVFQARYTVAWMPRLVTVDAIHLEAERAGVTVPFGLWIGNRGPDPVQITALSISPNPEAVFQTHVSVPRTLAPGETITVEGTFAPARAGSFEGSVAITSNDPAHDTVLVPIRAVTRDAAPSRRLALQVEPLTIPLGKPVQVVVRAEDTGNHAAVNGTVSITNYDRFGKLSLRDVPTNAPFSLTFQRQRTFDPAIKKWLPGEYPSGVVNAPGYELDANAPVPFVFH